MFLTAVENATRVEKWGALAIRQGRVNLFGITRVNSLGLMDASLLYVFFEFLVG